MKYYSLFSGAPYSDDEHGEEFTTIRDAERTAKRELNPGQRLTIYPIGSNEPRARWECGQDGRVYRVNV